VLGSISVLTTITYALYQFNSRVNKKWEYIQANPNLTPEQVAQILKTEEGGIVPTGETGNTVMWILIAGAVILIGPSLVKSFAKGN